VHRAILALSTLAATALLVSSAVASPAVHAHRGGSLAFGAPVLPEDTLPAFTNTATAFPGTWLELDSVVSSDGVPFVIHDSTLDRTTDCAGPVLEKTAAQVESCRVDKIGVSDTLVDPAPGAATVRVPRLADVLALAKDRRLSVNLEIKRIPGDPGYVPGDESFATAVLEVLKAAGLPRERMIVQSFDPTNLDTAQRVLPEAQLSFLTLAEANAAGPAFAAARGYDWISPGGVPSGDYVAQARALGLKVVPYTLNTPDAVLAAAAAGVDALITDDPPMARRALGVVAPAPVPAAAAPAAASPATVTFPPRSRATVLRRGGFAVTVRASRATRVTVTLRRGDVLLARTTVRLRQAGTRQALVRLTPAGRRVLRRARSGLRLTARITINGRRTTRPIGVR